MNLQESIRRILREEDRYDDKVGKTFWFEYHCYESPKSCDAEIWYRSHQKVKVIGVSEWSYDDKEWRQEDGNPRVYLVEWEDGFQYDVFEDELMESPNEFYRPSPPKRKIQESIRRILREEFNNLLNRLKPYLIEGKYLYHYTPTYNLDDIKEEGLIPRKTPNSFYKDGIEGIFLTNNSSLYSANLPQDLMNLMDEYYENGEEDEKPIVRLTVDVTQLNPNKITWDDDYIMNQYKWNKSNTDEDKIIESIDIWGTISYKGLIPPKLIINEDFDYLS